MKKTNLFLVGLTSLGVLAGGIMSTSALNNPQTKADILANLIGKSATEITEQKTSENKTYGTIAKENGVLEQFKNANLETTKAALKEKVEAGTITQEEADQMIANMEARMTNCDGTGQGMGKGLHNGTGRGSQYRMGNGQGIHRAE